MLTASLSKQFSSAISVTIFEKPELPAVPYNSLSRINTPICRTTDLREQHGSLPPSGEPLPQQGNEKRAGGGDR